MRTSFFHCLQTFCGNHDGHFLAELRDEKSLLLKVYVAAPLARRIEFSRADTIRIPATNEGGLTGDIAYASHMSPRILARTMVKVKKRVALFCCCNYLLIRANKQVRN